MRLIAELIGTADRRASINVSSFVNDLGDRIVVINRQIAASREFSADHYLLADDGELIALDTSDPDCLAKAKRS